MSKKIVLSDGREIEMREPKVRDMKLVEGIEPAQARQRKMVMNICLLTEAELDEFSMKDYMTLSDGLDSFLD